MFSFSILVVAFVIILYIPIIIMLRRRKAPIENYILYAIFYIYIAKVVDEVFFPIIYDPNFIETFRKQYHDISYNLIPFKNIIEYLIRGVFQTRQLLGNILLFVPMGYLLPLIKPKINKVNKVFLTSFCISFGIEIIQLSASFLYGFTYKYFDIDDIILNVFGAFIGYFSLKLTSPVIKKYTSLQLSRENIN